MIQLKLRKPAAVRQASQYRRYTRSRTGNVLYGAFLVLMGAFSVLPLLYCVLSAFKPLDELLVFPPTFFVNRPTTENFRVLPSLLNSLGVPLSRYFLNSVFVAVTSTALHILAASLAAFVFSKSRIRGRTVLFLIVQFALLYNAYTLAIPQYYIFSKLHIVDTYWVYILPAIPSSMGCFLMKQYMDASIPDVLLEAAYIDGARETTMFWRLVMPLVKPAWMTLMLFSFRDMWSIIPSGTIFSESLKTLPQVMSTIAAGGIARSGSTMAATVLLMIPPIIVFIISQRNVMETMSSAGIKE